MQHILVTGGNGMLAREIANIIPCTLVDRNDFDITDESAVTHFMKGQAFDILIHCAAYTDVAKAELHRTECYQTNVIGTENIVKHFHGQKFVYVSTDYVFDGKQGNYREEDTPNPINFYALSKLIGEIVVRQYPRTLIIRTSFKKVGSWPYPDAFVDQWTSADYVDVLAPDFVQAALMPQLFGTIHIAGTRKTVFDLAQKGSPDVGRMSRADVSVKLPYDTSLDSSRWRMIKKQQ